MITKILALGMLLVSAGVGASVHGAKEPWEAFDLSALPVGVELAKTTEGTKTAAADYAKERTALRREFGAAARRGQSYHGAGHPDARKAMRLARLQAKIGK